MINDKNYTINIIVLLKMTMLENDKEEQYEQ